MRRQAPVVCVGSVQRPLWLRHCLTVPGTVTPRPSPGITGPMAAGGPLSVAGGPRPCSPSFTPSSWAHSRKRQTFKPLAQVNARWSREAGLASEDTEVILLSCCRQRRPPKCSWWEVSRVRKGGGRYHRSKVRQGPGCPLSARPQLKAQHWEPRASFVFLLGLNCSSFSSPPINSHFRAKIWILG